MNFRRLFTAMALLALCVGLASAQIAVGPIGTTTAGPLTCSASVAAPPLLRSEGITDLIGDIVLTCTGGQVPAPGQPIPTANFTVSLGTNVTSRLLGTNGVSNASEALLLIDEPGSAQTPAAPGFGPGAAQMACGTPASGCVQYAQTDPSSGITVASSSATSITPALNVYQGLVNGNQVTFNGVPILAPSTTGVERIFRITNVRANVSGLGGGGLPGTTQLLASVSISGNTALPVNSPVQIAGFVQSGLSTKVGNTAASDVVSTTPFQQCSTQTKSAVATLEYSENFATAFKTRVAAPPADNGYAYPPVANQNIPGTIYNSESGFIAPYISTTNSVTNAMQVAGLADSGTRLKAVFNNLPAGVRVFVSTTNVTSATGSAVGQPGGQATTSFAQLVVSETTPDSGSIPTVTATTTVGGIPLAELPVVSGSATAVWEVVNSNPSLAETFKFGVYISYTANPGTNTPPVGTATVNMSFAPTSTVTTASASAFIPRFIDTSSASNLFSVAICQTVLLYPFVTNQAGFDTGIAIANTTTDPFGTGPQAGTCTLNFYGASAPAAAVVTDSIPTGTVFTTLASTSAAGFQGYMIAVCNFQLAHGFAFISDLGARNLAMGYLALVLPNGTGSRAATEQLEN